jgi:hypothetical protein
MPVKRSAELFLGLQVRIFKGGIMIADGEAVAVNWRKEPFSAHRLQRALKDINGAICANR